MFFPRTVSKCAGRLSCSCRHYSTSIFAEHLLGERLTVVKTFHSHLEPMKRLRRDELDRQISFSYLTYNGVQNTLDLEGPFAEAADPTRFDLECAFLVQNAGRPLHALISLESEKAPSEMPPRRAEFFLLFFERALVS